MEKETPPTSATYAVSRSRGKQPDESLYRAKLRERRKAKGQAKSSDESESEDEIEPGAVILHKLFNRRIVLQPDNTVVKSGKRIAVGEAEALRVAAQAGIPAPSVHDVHLSSDGGGRIRMDYIDGQPLDQLWPDMCAAQRKDVALQLREIVDRMRSAAPPPPNLIGACDGTEIRDTRLYFTYHSAPCRDEAGFNEFLLSSLYKVTPPLVWEAFTRRLRTDHRIVLSHCDLTPRNILVDKDGRIIGLVDWEDSGWYPEYWEYVKFFQRSADNDWRQYAEDIFSELYHDELVDYIAITKWQDS
ncbi:hypothetical protein JDV02_001320 [Purpureocillium takamizusanense]|uniref:Aminoglycoside phosphotransferase domain-containing protein n=1 Tax=Purpureocillium takamizusanense TaxID=2060973 RepID=A0A9Q8V7C5_9HYPO|nr:uncharacterized protein JDV02_001320 [Purpureocillium takamizusanense]UNI14719.1 hypothetical protein JDV02_001320 [Purpureocillium takamizusanense]